MFKSPAVFWLDRNRAHDAQLIKKVEGYLPEYDTKGLDLFIMPPEKATKFSLERIAQGMIPFQLPEMFLDYLTDLFQY